MKVKLDSEDRARAFSAFVVLRSRDLLRFATLVAADRQFAEDLVQDALASVYIHWDSIAGDPYAYARKAILNLQRDRWRRELRIRRPRSLLDRTTGPDIAADVVERDRVLHALRVLTRRERAAVVLRYYFDMSEHQIADELGIAPGTVKSTLSRARSKLEPILSTASDSHVEL